MRRVVVLIIILLLILILSCVYPGMLLLYLIVGFYIYQQRPAKKDIRRTYTYTGAGCVFGVCGVCNDTDDPPAKTIFNLIIELTGVTTSPEWVNLITDTPFKCNQAYIDKISKHNHLLRKLLDGNRVRTNISDFAQEYKSPYKNDIVPYRWDNYIDYTYPPYIFVIPETITSATEQTHEVNNQIVSKYVCLGYQTKNKIVQLYNNVCSLTRNDNELQDDTKSQKPLLLYKRILDIPVAADISTTTEISKTSKTSEQHNNTPVEIPPELAEIRGEIIELYKHTPVWDQDPDKYKDIVSSKRAREKLYRCACAKFHLRVHTAWHTSNILFLKWQTCWMHVVFERIDQPTYLDSTEAGMLNSTVTYKTEIDGHISEYKTLYTRRAPISLIGTCVSSIKSALDKLQTHTSSNLNEYYSNVIHIRLKYNIWAHIVKNKNIHLYEKTGQDELNALMMNTDYKLITGDAYPISDFIEYTSYMGYLTETDYSDTLKISRHLFRAFILSNIKLVGPDLL